MAMSSLSLPAAPPASLACITSFPHSQLSPHSTFCRLHHTSGLWRRRHFTEAGPGQKLVCHSDHSLLFLQLYGSQDTTSTAFSLHVLPLSWLDFSVPAGCPRTPSCYPWTPMLESLHPAMFFLHLSTCQGQNSALSNCLNLYSYNLLWKHAHACTRTRTCYAN